LKAKKSRENLEKFLMSHEKIDSTTKYYKCEEMFSNMEVWKAVPEPDRRDIYDDCIFNLTQREKEEARVLKKRNIKVLSKFEGNLWGFVKTGHDFLLRSSYRCH
jgi:pre-mRNA-processing factor 40